MPTQAEYTEDDLKEAREHLCHGCEVRTEGKCSGAEEWAFRCGRVIDIATALRARERKGYRQAAYENEDSVKRWTENARQELEGLERLFVLNAPPAGREW